MITTKESITQVSSTSHDASEINAVHLAGSIAENLHDGEYILSMIPNMVIFIRSDDWFDGITIEEIDFETAFTVTLSTGRSIQFHPAQIQKSLKKVDQYRIVLLSGQGHSVFKISV